LAQDHDGVVKQLIRETNSEANLPLVVNQVNMHFRYRRSRPKTQMSDEEILILAGAPHPSCSAQLEATGARLGSECSIDLLLLLAQASTDGLRCVQIESAYR
jgi:hypothetical protein